MKKNADAMREFYSIINEIRDLYENHGFKKQKSLYNEMKEKYNWKMSYKSFTIYFNKEIKPKEEEKLKEPIKIQTQNNNTVKTGVESDKEARLKAEVIAEMNAYGEKQERIKKKYQQAQLRNSK